MWIFHRYDDIKQVLHKAESPNSKNSCDITSLYIKHITAVYTRCVRLSRHTHIHLRKIFRRTGQCLRIFIYSAHQWNWAIRGPEGQPQRDCAALHSCSSSCCNPTFSCGWRFLAWNHYMRGKNSGYSYIWLPRQQKVADPTRNACPLLSPLAGQLHWRSL